MTILNDKQISELANNGMISPFIDHQVKEILSDDDEFGTCPQRIISKGLSSFGYDLTLSNKFLAYNRAYSVHQDASKWNLVVDPLNFDAENLLEEFEVSMGDYVIMPPHGYYLSHCVEYVKMPSNISALCITKSTYARAGIFLNVTPIEAGWEGIITLEIANLTDRPVKIYTDQGIAQLQFFQGERPQVTYADRKGKYQGQTNITLPKA